jgi:type IV pilus assembly protein PilY1
MQPRHVCFLVLLSGLLMTDSMPASAAASSCNPGDCLANSAVAQRVQPTTVNNDDKGDVTFFSTQSGQLPNIVFVLDNSTSMYELPYDVNPFPNSAWVTLGKTPNAASTSRFDSAANVQSCHANTYFESLRDANGNAYNKATAYAPPDSAFTGFFDNTKIYKWFEWAMSSTTAPAGTANGSDPVAALLGGAATGTPTAACSAMSSSTGSGGSGGSGLNAWSITQRQRCQQCLSEAGYYIGPSAVTNDSFLTGSSVTGNIVFKGNWLNFFPPKFIIARKTLTDFISRQSSTPTPVRIAVVTYDPNNVQYADLPSATTGLRSGDGGHFILPTGMTAAGMVPDCNQTDWKAAATVTKQTNMLAAVRAISWGSNANTFPGGPIATPIAETLFNVGQFYGGSNSFYNSTFGSQWVKAEFTAATDLTKPLCVACQVNAIVLITDGAPEGDNNLPQLFRNDTIECSPNGNAAPPNGCGKDLWAGPSPAANPSNNLLDDVTNYFAITDMDGSSANGIQDIITFVIGVGLKVPLLDNAAQYGKSSASMRANNAQDLQDEVTSAVANVVARATAFSSTAIQTLEVGTGSTAYVPRFIPGSPTDATWEGHLFRFDLFNEFVAGVDKNGDGNLNGVFLVDKDSDIITEDDKGSFHKQKNNAPAVPIWDAGDDCNAGPKCTSSLQVTGAHHLNEPGSAANRTIYTAIWDTSVSPAAWKTIALPSWDGGTLTPKPANYDTVGNLLAIDGTNACAQIQASMATPIPAAYLSVLGTFDRDHCIKAILDYVRGYNILNEVANNTSVTINRPRMLGDIFHSSPVVVDPPVDQFICSLGLHAQCISTLYGYQNPPAVAMPTPTDMYTVGTAPNTRSVDAYEKYWEDHETRQRIVLVGANDGMLHAFDAGTPTTSPPTLNPGVGFRQVVYSNGTGNELWAFIPPDQLARLWLMMRDGHQMYMDGDIMVRDVWVDGQKNDRPGTFTNDVMVKQDVEFHTVAVVSERQGGTHFTGFDITDTTNPKLLWMYPPPCSPEEQLWGQTYGQFSPRPPPIGPVLLQTSNTAGKANYGYAHTEERWAVFVNGGHSPYNNRGRAAAILDVYTGAPLFVAKYNPSSTDSNDPALGMRFGFPATAAMVDYGRGSVFEQDGFFDTAVVGDEGGQIWTFRFGEPGNINSTTGLVDNWTFARAYEPDTSSGGTIDPRKHQPIYTVASTTVQQETGWLRAFVGTGDRAHVRSNGFGDCRADDPMSCIAAGCTVSTSMTYDNGPNHYVSTFGSANGTSQNNPKLASPTQTQTTTTNSCNSNAINETVTVSSCPASGMNFTGPANGSGLSETCTGSPLSCTEAVTFKYPMSNTNLGLTSFPSGASNEPIGNSFMSVAILADSTGMPTARARRLNLPGANNANADSYDQNRLQLSDLQNVSTTTATTSAVTGTVASRNDAGWYLRYYDFDSSVDEKTVTSSTVLGGCVIWSSLIPTGGAVGCASSGSTISSFYQADALTGAPNCAASFLSGNNFTRNVQRNVLSPPPEPAAAVAVGAGGASMRFSTLEIQPGASEVTQMTVNTTSEMLQLMYSLPLSYDQHVCRHVDPLKCE